MITTLSKNASQKPFLLKLFFKQIQEYNLQQVIPSEAIYFKQTYRNP